MVKRRTRRVEIPSVDERQSLTADRREFRPVVAKLHQVLPQQ